MVLIQAWAQGPELSYFYDPATELSWAECYVYQEGGSKQKLPFFTVVNRHYHGAPMGTNKYSKDIDIDARLVFIGNGIVKENDWNAYVGKRFDSTQGEIDVRNFSQKCK